MSGAVVTAAAALVAEKSAEVATGVVARALVSVVALVAVEREEVAIFVALVESTALVAVAQLVPVGTSAVHRSHRMHMLALAG